MTALLLYGGMTLPFAIGAVVDGLPTTSHTPLSGQRSPVRAVVPMAVVTGIHSLLREKTPKEDGPIHTGIRLVLLP
ncbi:hypothetical protein ABZS66_14085 [Dactylosporangium sp. NPDC005572]|uniref:hypothetical protein n=1 Tax=Dactylosporangium sp. NPDC005572 TaxID=3156889 RepID=UPI0033A64B02